MDSIQQTFSLPTYEYITVNATCHGELVTKLNEMKHIVDVKSIHIAPNCKHDVIAVVLIIKEN